MDLEIKCKKLEIDGWDCNFKTVSAKLENIDVSDLNNVEVAKQIDLDIIFAAFSEDELKVYVKHNYDWFD
jgi:hypothetical protein